MPVCDYEYNEEKMQARINCLGCLYGSSVEDYPDCMARVIDVLLEAKKVTSIVMVRNREYEYDYSQVRMLSQIARVIEWSMKDSLVSKAVFSKPEYAKCYPEAISNLNYILIELLRKDPIGGYVELIREVRRVKTRMKRSSGVCHKSYQLYVTNTLDLLRNMLESTDIIKKAIPRLPGYRIGDRAIYREMFLPSVRPNFMLTRYMVTPPKGGTSVDRYKASDTQIEIYKLPNSTQYMYHAMPPEFMLSEEKYAVLDAVRRYMAEHRPKTAEFVRSEKVREVFYNIGKDMTIDVAAKMKVSLTSKEVEQLANILTRYTAGMGVLEILLADEKIQDVFINSPIEKQPILIYHEDWGECKTNLMPTREDAEAWATRLRIASGRPLDEANPVLDVNVDMPGGSARFAVITKSLSPQGLGFAIRRHRDMPWTLPLFIKNRMLNPLAAGLLSFLIDGTVSMLVAGGRGAGKTSVLSSLMLEILPQVRVVTIEDSVTGDTGIVYENGGEMKNGTVGGLVDKMIHEYNGENILGRDILAKNPKNVKVFSMNKEGKIVLAPVSRFIRHKVNKEMFKVTTATGREISVTKDHSLFTMGENGEIIPIKTKDIKVGDFIVTPRILRNNNKKLKHIDILRHLDKMKDFNIIGTPLKKLIVDNWVKCKEIGKNEGYTKSGIAYWKRAGILPVSVFQNLMKNTTIDFSKIKIKGGAHSNKIPIRIDLDEDFLTFIGLWLADGCYDRNSIIMSVSSKEERNLCKRISRRFGIKIKKHSDGFSLMINSNTLKKIMKDVLELNGNAYTKKIPQWAYRLSKKQAGWIIKGLYSGDGCVSDKEIIMSLCSKEMLNGIQTLLLNYGIILRIGGFKKSDKTYRSSISSLKSIKLFNKHVGILQRYKRKRLDLFSSNISTHDTSDVVPMPLNIKNELDSICKGFYHHDYIERKNNIGRQKLKRILKEIPDSKTELKEKISKIAYSDIFWDRVKEIKQYKKSKFVYDFSVPGYENFICNNILAHNTLELPVNQMRDLGYNIEQLKTRSVITRVETEMPAEEALRTALRLGDSALIMGEVRSGEAKALYEAMRIGALSNVVAGTIHGESAYGVFDRVVNDLGVPSTSFKATDIIPICKSLRSADGMHRFRRMTEITEVRKEWDKDPSKENGFVNLMEYSSKEDGLKPTDTFVNGESEILNRISSYVKEWSGNWDAVWENINLRAKIKKAVVDISDKLENPVLLESKWVIQSNAKYHLISEKIRKEIGFPDSNMVFKEWSAWFNRAAVKAK